MASNAKPRPAIFPKRGEFLMGAGIQLPDAVERSAGEEQRRCGEERHCCAENEEKSERGHAARRLWCGMLALNSHTLTISQSG
jgi:hypothetical protein